MTNPLIGMTIVFGVFCALFILLRTWQQRCHPDPELVRKVFHVAMGVFTLSLPWLFVEAWPVWLMCGVTVALLLAVRIAPGWQCRFGAVLGGVTRRSFGEIYFSVGVALLFYLAKDALVLYVVPVLLLTFADAAAALIGKRWGRHRYQSLSGHKSLEGSFGFLLIAIACVALPLSVTDLAAKNLWLIAVTLSLLLMLIEALATRGLDNLLLPLSACFLLQDFIHRTQEELTALLIFAILLVLPIVLAVKTNTDKNRKGLIA